MELENRGKTRLSPSREVTVRANDEIAPGVFSLRYPRDSDFLPGQVVAVTAAPEIPARYYSIASGTCDAEVELLYDLVPDGALTPGMSGLAVGDKLIVSRPFGSFLDPSGESWWIATGTGIAPFLSMARSGTVAGKRLIHGGRTPDNFYYRDYFSSRLGHGYVCCCSAEQPRFAYPGRLSKWLRERGELPRDSSYLLCGSAGMVVDVRDILISKGVPFENITGEIYF